jgi:hypothetical protein
MGKRNWRRGLFRLWIVASILWVVGVVGYMMHLAIQDNEVWVQLFCYDLSSPPREGTHECYMRAATYEGRRLHSFEQSGPPASPLELAKWELKRQELHEAMTRAVANKETPFWSNLRYNWIILPFGPVLFLVVGGIVATVIAWIGRGFARTPNQQARA